MLPNHSRRNQSRAIAVRSLVWIARAALASAVLLSVMHALNLR